ncbi:MAG: AMP-binding protein, partial [Archaeoglobaceae archaeon]|nr:AMP-binding protein [Archaeoglobaceae archaeon]
MIVKGFPSTMMDYQLNVIDMLKYAAKYFPKREIASKRLDGTMFRYNYFEAYKRVSRLANALESLGVRVGDRVGVMSWNTHRFYELYFAIPGIGAVLLQINLRLHPEEMAYVVKHSGTNLIFVDESLLPLVIPLLDTVKANFVVMSDGKPPETFFETYNYEDLLKEQDEKYDFPVLDERSAFSACYTSGTTGKPKGVYFSHRSIVLHSMAVLTALSVNRSDVFLQLVPMFHASGWGGFFAATMAGGKIVFPGRFTLEDLTPIVDLIRSEGVTVTAGAPVVFIPILNYLKSLESKPKFNLRAFSGATEPPLAMMKELKEFGIEIIHAYGATETSPLVCYNFLKPELETLSEEEKWDLK